MSSVSVRTLFIFLIVFSAQQSTFAQFETDGGNYSSPETILPYQALISNPKKRLEKVKEPIKDLKEKVTEPIRIVLHESVDPIQKKLNDIKDTKVVTSNFASEYSLVASGNWLSQYNETFDGSTIKNIPNRIIQAGGEIGENFPQSIVIQEELSFPFEPGELYEELGDVVHDEVAPFVKKEIIKVKELGFLGSFPTPVSAIKLFISEYREELSYWEVLRPSRFEISGHITDGNRYTWQLRVDTRWKHETDAIKHEARLVALQGEQENVETANEWKFRDTFDYKSLDKPWLIFSQLSAEHDEVELIALRANTTFGIGYRWVDRKDAEIITRLGPSFAYTRTFKPREITYKPEVVFEFELDYDFSYLKLEIDSITNQDAEDSKHTRMTNNVKFLIPIGSSAHWKTGLALRHDYNNAPQSGVFRNDYKGVVSLTYER
jgi:hypothetical protein